MSQTHTTVIDLQGPAWWRDTQGTLHALNEGMQIPPNTQVITARGTQLTLQTGNQAPITIAGGDSVTLNTDSGIPPQPEATADTAAAAQITPPPAAASGLQTNAAKPFDAVASLEELEPTEAILGAEGGSGHPSYVESLQERTTALDLQFGKAAVSATSSLEPFAQGAAQASPVQPSIQPFVGGPAPAPAPAPSTLKLHTDSHTFMEGQNKSIQGKFIIDIPDGDASLATLQVGSHTFSAQALLLASPSSPLTITNYANFSNPSGSPSSFQADIHITHYNPDTGIVSYTLQDKTPFINHTDASDQYVSLLSITATNTQGTSSQQNIELVIKDSEPLLSDAIHDLTISRNTDLTPNNVLFVLHSNEIFNEYYANGIADPITGLNKILEQFLYFIDFSHTKHTEQNGFVESIPPLVSIIIPGLYEGTWTDFDNAKNDALKAIFSEDFPKDLETHNNVKLSLDDNQHHKLAPSTVETERFTYYLTGNPNKNTLEPPQDLDATLDFMNEAGIQSAVYHIHNDKSITAAEVPDLSSLTYNPKTQSTDPLLLINATEILDRYPLSDLWGIASASEFSGNLLNNGEFIDRGQGAKIIGIKLHMLFTDRIQEFDADDLQTADYNVFRIDAGPFTLRIVTSDVASKDGPLSGEPFNNSLGQYTFTHGNGRPTPGPYKFTITFQDSDGDITTTDLVFDDTGTYTTQAIPTPDNDAAALSFMDNSANDDDANAPSPSFNLANLLEAEDDGALLAASEPLPAGALRASSSLEGHPAPSPATDTPPPLQLSHVMDVAPPNVDTLLNSLLGADAPAASSAAPFAAPTADAVYNPDAQQFANDLLEQGKSTLLP